MVESCWGGTSIESWSSAEALAACAADPARPTSPSTAAATSAGEEAQRSGDHYTAMIRPLLNMTIKGAVWYQGEANGGTVTSGNRYACQIRALIKDWRSKWNQPKESRRSKPWPESKPQP